MINLSEAWKLAYEEYLEEEYKNLDSELDSIMTEMATANDEAKRSFELIEQFISLQGDTELLKEWDNDEMIPGASSKNVSVEAGTSNRKGQTYTPSGTVAMDLGQFVTTLSKLNNNGETALDYKPLASIKVERIGDMKFPNNLIFFLKQLVLWIRNVVIFFINKLLNAIRVVIGKPIKELDPQALKVSFSKASKLAVTSAQFNAGKKVSPEDAQKFLQVVDVDTLKEDASLLDLFGLRAKEKVDSAPEIKEKIVVINIEKDLQDLRLLMEHFYTIFDSAYGTNNEYLFGTEDLTLIFNLFKTTLQRLKSGEIPNVALIGDHATEIDVISADTVRNNLRLTSVNMNSLKDAYQATAAKIKMILQMIQSKEMLMLTNLGVAMQTLSAATIGTIQEVAAEIPERKKEAVMLEKQLEQMRKVYSDLTTSIGKLQSSVVSLGTIQYSTIYNKRIQELFMASKDMTDIVTMRLAGVSLYCKELKEVEDILLALLRLNKYEFSNNKK